MIHTLAQGQVMAHNDFTADDGKRFLSLTIGFLGGFVKFPVLGQEAFAEYPIGTSVEVRGQATAAKENTYRIKWGEIRQAGQAPPQRRAA